jgi:hypothetical protein
MRRFEAPFKPLVDESQLCIQGRLSDISKQIQCVMSDTKHSKFYVPIEKRVVRSRNEEL